MINWRSTYAIYRNELVRFMRTVFGSLISPVLTTSLYFIVFGAAIGGRMNAVGDRSSPARGGGVPAKAGMTEGFPPLDSATPLRQPLRGCHLPLQGRI